MIEVIFDTETTGLIKPGANDISKQPYITEIYCYKQHRLADGEVVQMMPFESMLCPAIPITAEITKITGITQQMCDSAPSFIEVWEELAEFMTGVDRIVAHNLAFDRSMLANELVRIGKVLNFPWPRQHVCTVEKSMKYEQRRLSLTRLHEYLFATDFPNAHRAKNDVLPLVRCYNKMIEKGDVI